MKQVTYERKLESARNPFPRIHEAEGRRCSVATLGTYKIPDLTPYLWPVTPQTKERPFYEQN